MLKRVMVPVDGSAFAESALPFAVLLSRGSDARLHLVMVHERMPLTEAATIFGSETIDSQQRQTEEAYLADLARSLEQEEEIAVERSVITGAPGTALARFSSRRGMDMIIMSTHGRGALSRMWLGSVADQLIRRSRMPVLLVRPSDDTDEGTTGEARARDAIRRVLIAVDGSADAEVTLRHAGLVCAAMGAECTVIRVVVPPARAITSRIPDTAAAVRDRTDEETREAEDYLRKLIRDAPDLPAASRSKVVVGYDTAAAILRAAETEPADVIAIAAHGHGGAARLLLGSVADKVIRGSDVPVLVCPVPQS